MAAAAVLRPGAWRAEAAGAYSMVHSCQLTVLKYGHVESGNRRRKERKPNGEQGSEGKIETTGREV